MIRNNINIDNYEIFIIDYLDGKLSQDQSVDLMSFLDENPEIKEDIEDLNNFSLQANNENYDFSKLKKPLKLNPPTNINSKNIDKYLIAELEGDISESEKEEIRVFIVANPQFLKSQTLIVKTKLIADKRIKLVDKTLLYKLLSEIDEPINSENFAEYCIAFHENDLSKDKKNELLAFMASNEKLVAEFKSIANLKIIPDISIVFEDKNSLKKLATIYYFDRMKFVRVAAIAAIIAIFFVFSSILNQINFSSQYPQMANIIKQQNLPKKESKFLKNGASYRVQEQKKAIKKQDIKRITIATADKKEALIKSQISTIEQITTYKRVVAYAQTNSPDGYYQAVAAESNFLKNNPTLTKRVIKEVRHFLNISAENIKADDDRFTLWDIADAGLKGLGALTENDIVLSRK